MPADSDPIVAAVVTLVEHHAPGRWDTPGITAQVRTLLGNGIPARDVLAAACNAADDPKATTPAAMAWTQHRPRGTATEAVDRGPQCRACGRTRSLCESVTAKFDPGHQFEPPFAKER